MQLLADKLVAIGAVETISDETVCRVLKKRPQALVEIPLVYRHGWCGFRVAHGGCLGPVRPAETWVGPVPPIGEPQ